MTYTTWDILHVFACFTSPEDRKLCGHTLGIYPYLTVMYDSLTDGSVISVGPSYWYPGMGYAFHIRTRGRSVTSVQHHTLPKMFCDFFCTTFIPLPDSSETSVTNFIPYRKYPYPTEHTLVACACVRVYPFKLGFRVHHLIYLILDCCRQTTRI